MSEEFIRVYKPAVARSAALETTTPKRSKSKTRKSVGQKDKRKDVTPDVSNTDVLLKIFNSFDEKINETKKNIHKDLFESIYENTIQYFGFYESKREVFEANTTSTSSSMSASLGLNPICNVIPTVALYTGINVQDYSYLCDKLSGSLRENFSEYLFFVNEKNAHNIKSLVNSIYTQWENLIEDEDERLKLPKRNMFTFRQFFQSIQALNKDSSKPKSVVFFFKQFELIPKETIECFVSLISCYVENVAIYFILELASQSNIISQQLSSGVISKLCIKKLFLMSPSQYIDKFITQLFIESNHLFRVSGDILKYLVDLYNDYNYSISSLTHALKFCFYDHLHGNSLNALMLSEELDDFQLYEQVYEQTINENEANREYFKQTVCPSLGNTSISICLQRIQTQMRQYTSEFLLVSQLLYEIIKHFPITSTRDEAIVMSLNADSSILTNVKTFSDLFVRIWAWSSSACASGESGSSFCDSEEYSHLRKLLQLTSSSTLSSMIESMVNLIENKAMEKEASYDVEFLNDLFTFHDDILEVLKTKLAACNQELNRSFNEENEEENEEIAELKSAAAKVKRSKSLVARRPSMRGSTLKPISENSPTKKQKPTILSRREDKQKLIKEIDMLKSNMIAWLSEKFTRYFSLKTFTAQPFMHNFCYTNLDRLKKAVCDVQRLNVHACLMNSFEHVSSSDLLSSEISESQESPSSQKRRRNSTPSTKKIDLNNPNLGLLPINIVYRLYLECGHMINLYDWLQAYVEKMENAGIEDLDEAKKKRLIALFFRSITEMQFMGFIKPTSRKVDHVVKLTNGSSVLALEAN